MNVLFRSDRARWTLIAVAAATFASGVTAQETKEETKSAYQPEAMQVIDRYVEAIGGEKALRAQKYRTLEGELSLTGMNIKGPLKMYQAAPARFLMLAEMAGVGKMRTGYDGKVAWSIDPMQGPMLIEGAQAEEMRRQADFYGELNFKKNYKAIEYAGRERFNGVEAHKLRLVDRLDKESFAFIHAEEHLFIGLRTESETPMGPIPTTTLMSEYREFDGVKMPTVIRMQMMGMEQRITIKSVSHDPISDEQFALPEEVKALLPEDEKEDKKENE